MNRLMKYLCEKTHFLEKFFGLNEVHLPEFRENDFANLEFFYHSRDTVLDIISYLDEIIREEMKTNGFLNYETVTDARMKEQLSYHDLMINKVLKQDLEILSLMDSAKSGMIQELQQVRQGKKVTAAYHSGTRRPLVDREV